SRGGPDDRLGDGPRAVPLETGSGHAPGQLAGYDLRVTEVGLPKRASQPTGPRCQLSARLLRLGDAVLGEDRLEDGPRIGPPLPLGSDGYKSLVRGPPTS